MKLKAIQKEYYQLANHDLFSCDYSWGGIDFPARIKEWTRFEKNNETIALNILQVPHSEIKITHAYKSEYNHTRKNQVVLLMITDGKNGIILL